MKALLVRKGPVTCVVAPSLDRFDFLSHAFCTRQGGVSRGAYAGLNVSPLVGDNPGHVEKNWGRLSESFGIPRDGFFLLRQLHEDGLLILDGGRDSVSYSEPPGFDALITNRPNVALCIKTADCVPVLLLDPRRRVVAAVHAGWRGTALNITGKVVAAMTEQFGSQAAEIIAAVGPSIGACCYEVDTPVVVAMEAWRNDPEVCRPSTRDGRWMLNLPGINEKQMLLSGLTEGHISRLDLCTSCREDLFFSHRRDGGRTGRQVHFIMLREGASSIGPA